MVGRLARRGRVLLHSVHLQGRALPPRFAQHETIQTQLAHTFYLLPAKQKTHEDAEELPVYQRGEHPGVCVPVPFRAGTLFLFLFLRGFLYREGSYQPRRQHSPHPPPQSVNVRN